jgi:hypothetical protein
MATRLATTPVLHSGGCWDAWSLWPGLLLSRRRWHLPLSIPFRPECQLPELATRPLIIRLGAPWESENPAYGLILTNIVHVCEISVAITTLPGCRLW